MSLPPSAEHDAGVAVAGPSARGSRRADVVAVAEATTSLMALLYGGFLGALSALLVVRVSEDLLPQFQSPIQRAALGLFTWVASTWALSRGAAHLLMVFRRACLLGSAEWLALLLWARAEPVVHASTRGGLRASTADVLGGGVAATMLALCVAGWLLCRWIRPADLDSQRADA